MFGYVTARLDRLTEEERKRYNSFYCGLCHALGERHGLSSRMTLTYDMTFLVILLSSLYEPEEQGGERSCPAHPFKKRGYIRNAITDYAADMNIALSYLNLRDDWKDDGSLVSLAEAKLFESSYREVSRRYPRQCGVIKECLSELDGLEKSWKPDPDAASRTFGRLMSELFVYEEDRWSDTLRAFGMALGQFIYVMDACIDLRDDKRFYKYNPFIPLFNRPDEKEQFGDILRMLLGSCVFSFDKLPLVQDAGILRNVLCLGVWRKYNSHYKIEEE